MSATVATPESFNKWQLRAIEDTERACSVLSLLGTTFIIGSFIGSSSFRKPINRMVFYASWGNTMANIATLISRSGLYYGVTGPLCQFQAFFIQWFMPADALWIFCMACNVYLTIFHKYDASHLRALEWKHITFCYGLPLVPAFVLLFVKSQSRSNVYGSAILWCWIRPEWDVLRITLFYAPVWLIIFSTSGIYILVGKEIFEKHRQLCHLSWVTNTGGPEQPHPAPPIPSRATLINITSEPALVHRESSSGGTLYEEEFDYPGRQHHHHHHPYSVSINSGRPTSQHYEHSANIQLSPSIPPAPPRRTSMDANSAVSAYTKCALLFFLSLVVTWVPSTINRVYAFAQPDAMSFPLNYFSSFVLPLQGFWNCIIYIAFSFPACKDLFHKLSPRQVRRRLSDHGTRHSSTSLAKPGWNLPLSADVAGTRAVTPF